MTSAGSEATSSAFKYPRVAEMSRAAWRQRPEALASEGETGSCSTMSDEYAMQCSITKWHFLSCGASTSRDASVEMNVTIVSSASRIDS